MFFCKIQGAEKTLLGSWVYRIGGKHAQSDSVYHQKVRYLCLVRWQSVSINIASTSCINASFLLIANLQKPKSRYLCTEVPVFLTSFSYLDISHSTPHLLEE